MLFPNKPDECLVDISEVRREYSDKSDATYWRWIKEGKFPKPTHKIGNRRHWTVGVLREHHTHNRQK